MLVSARSQARQKFEENRSLQSGSDELTKQITMAEEVAKFLRENLVQGQAQDNNSYSMCQDNKFHQVSRFADIVQSSAFTSTLNEETMRILRKPERGVH